MLQALNGYTHAVLATIQLVKQLGTKVCNSTINQSIQNHPDNQAIIAIADSLQKWHIDNTVLKVNPEKLAEIPTPFIAHTHTNQFLTVTQINNNTLAYNTEGKTITTTHADFIQIWSGIVLLAETNQQSGEEQYKKNRQKEIVQVLKIPILLLLAVLAITINGWLVYQQNIPIQQVIYYIGLTFLKLAGVVVTGLLLWYEIDKANPILKQICTAGTKTNCNAILNSKQSKLFGIISWSEVGFFYFSTTFLYAILTNNGNISCLTFLNLFALPYTLFSIYYQWRIVKQWCVLCLAVQAILLLEFLVALLTNQFINLTPINQLASKLINPQLLIPSLLPILLWYIIKPSLLTAQENKRNKQALMRLKYDTRIFNALLPKQKQIVENAQGLGISMGNPNAENTIIKVCNPYCGPCATAHPEIEAILEANPNVKAQIIFTATNKDDDKRTKPVKHLLAIAAQQNQAITKQALDDWYLAKEKNYEAFAAKYPLNGEVEKQGEKVEQMDKWCTKTKIEFTPSIFINGYLMPDVYTVKDLKYLLS